MTGPRPARHRLVAVDLDGTLLNSRHEISERNLLAIKRLQERGVKVVVVTGRASYIAARWVRRLGAGGYHITFNGAAVVDYDRAAHFNVQYMRPGPAADLTGWLEAHRVWYAAHTLETPYSPWEGREESAAFERIGDPIPEVARVTPYIDRLLKVMLVLCEGTALENELRSLFEGPLAVARTGPSLLEFMNPRASKGAALAWVAAAYGVVREEVVAFGDSQNDVSMFENAGLAVAMGNASDAARQAAHVVCEDCDSDGVACALERFVFPCLE
ncbi:MAG: HAD family phosphatase [Firmicutes bacterium]|nr:HAD family phosphatase [Bacillota bacterium]